MSAMTLRFGGKPIAQETTRAVVPFTQKVNELARQLAPPLKMSAGTKDDLVEKYVGMSAEVQKLYPAIETLLEKTVEANFSMSVVNQETREDFKREIIRIGKTVVTRLPSQTSRLDLLGLYGKEGAVIYEAMKADLVSQMATLLTGLFSALQALQHAEQIGQVEFPTPNTCRFTSYRWRYMEKLVREYDAFEDTHRGYTVRVHKRDVEKELWQELHCHELIDARRYPLLSDTPVPERVKPVRDSVPPPLRPLVEVVDGKEVMRQVYKRLAHAETTTETETVVTRQLVYNPDPVVMIDGFALTFWDATVEAVVTPRKQAIPTSEDINHPSFLEKLFLGKKR